MTVLYPCQRNSFSFMKMEASLIVTPPLSSPGGLFHARHITSNFHGLNCKPIKHHEWQVRHLRKLVQNIHYLSLVLPLLFIMEIGLCRVSVFTSLPSLLTLTHIASARINVPHICRNEEEKGKVSIQR